MKTAKRALILAITITAMGVVLTAIYPSRVNYLLLPGWLATYVLGGGVHGNGPLAAIMSHSVLLCTLIAICNSLIFAGLSMVALRIWKSLRSYFP